MSKSATSEYNYIGLLDDAETVKKKIKKAVTDSGNEIVYSDDKPALKNLINIYSAFSEKTSKEIEKMYAGRGYADFKNDLSEEIIKFLEPFQKKFKDFSNEEVLKILEEGAEKARPLAEKKIKEVKEKIGFIM
jgi:tryptophanyl-tRNA synthetase